MEHNTLLTNLRIVGALELSEYIYVKLDYNIKWRYSNSFINCCSNPLQTWGYTHNCLKKIYCEDLPQYIADLYLLDPTNKTYKLTDLLSVLTQSIKGLEQLKQTYQMAYKKIYDEKFDTLIDSYAKIQLQQVKDLIIDRPTSGILAPITE